MPGPANSEHQTMFVGAEHSSSQERHRFVAATNVATLAQRALAPQLIPNGYAHRAPSRRLLSREARYRRALFVADLVAGVIALEFSLSVLGEDRVSAAALLVTLPLLVILSKLHGLYDRDDLLVRKTTIEEMPRIFQHATLATLMLVLLDRRLGIGQIGDEQALAVWFLLAGVTVCARMLARKVAGRLSPPERVLVLGEASAALDLRDRAADRLRVEFVGAVSLEGITSDDLPGILDTFDVDRVIVAPSSSAAAHETPEMVRAAKAAGVRVSVLPGVVHVVGSQVEYDDVFGLTLLGVRRFGLTRTSRAIKRAFDVLLVVTTSVVTLPTVLICAILVKRTSRGPVFFRQERIGLDGQHFQILKLRTMVDDADALKKDLIHLNEGGDGLFKIAEDPRVTRVGCWLRRTHLDELPQLLNVLRGEMSIVGPRPLIRDEDHQIKGLDRRRLELTPGMTGPWQILGSRGRRVPMSEMLKLDYVYAANWSLWNDTKIVLRTAAAVARRDGV